MSGDLPGIAELFVTVITEQPDTEFTEQFAKETQRHRGSLCSEAPRTIRFRDLDGASFARYEGRWRVTDDNGHTLVAYDLTPVPSFSVPGALLGRLLKRDSAAMITQLRREIGRSICHADGRS